jgi:formate hydrogenlyase subunit 3/multisubunit Na+/H+ antiporter MnhD subunit
VTSIDRLVLIGLVLFPLTGAAIALIAGLRGRSRTVVLAGASGIVAVIASAAWALTRTVRAGTLTAIVGGWSPETGIGLVLDTPAACILVTIGLVSLGIFLYAVGSTHGTTVFVVVFQIALAGLAAIVLAEDLFNLFVALEVVSLAAVILVAYQRTTRALYAAFRYLVISTVSIALYLVGFLALYRVTGELALTRISAALLENPPGSSSGVVAVASALIVAGLATRVATVPFHVWLPDAHGSAPHPVSALLSGLVLKAGFLALWRVVRMLPPGVARLDLVLVTFGAMSAVVGVLLALAQSDAKRLLAYHSISQMGLIVLGAGAAGSVSLLSAAGGAAFPASAAYTGTVFHAMSHATFKSLLFLVVGVMVTRWGTHDLYQLRERNRLAPPAHIERILYLIGAGAIAGVPGLSGYVGKTLISGGVKDYLFLSFLVKAVSVGTVASFIKLGTVFLAGPGGTRGHGPETVPMEAPDWSARPDPIPDPTPGSTPGPRRSRLLVHSGMVLLAVLTVALGVVGGATLGVFSRSAITDSGLTIAAGIAVYMAVRTVPGRAIAHRVGSIRLGLDAALVCILAGTVLVAVMV